MEPAPELVVVFVPHADPATRRDTAALLLRGPALPAVKIEPVMLPVRPSALDRSA